MSSKKNKPERNSYKDYRKSNKDQDFEKIYNKAKNERKDLKRAPNKGKKAKNKKRIWLRVLIIVIVFVLIVFAGTVAAFFYYFGGLKTSKFTEDSKELGISDDSKFNDTVTNIALFGIDAREEDKENGRSDTTMIASFDGVHKEIKLTSILRDSRVKIEGHGQDKLCHAYAYGGPKLAVKTLNQNYNMNIKEYVTVNFTHMAQIIDKLGGLELTLTKEERVAANGLIASTPELSYSEEIPEFKTNPQKVQLNGSQAVSYARIRKIDSESERANRQQIVMQAIFDKILAMNVLGYPQLIKDLLPFVQTSLSYQDMLGFIPFAVSGKPKIVSNTIPDQNDPKVKGGIVNGVWYWTYDLKDYSNRLHDFIYNKE